MTLTVLGEVTTFNPSKMTALDVKHTKTILKN